MKETKDRSFYIKLATVAGSVALTVAIHYGWVLHHIFGHNEWVHALHGRFCYIPIVIGAAWFGLRGGLITAAIITVLVAPYVFTGPNAGSPSGEIVEVFFYFAIAVLSGALVDREWFQRRKSQEAQLHLERGQRLSMLGQMAAGVAHEIKNPLASIKGSVDILSNPDTKPDDRQEFADIVGREVKRIDSTVKDFLEFARPRQTARVRLNLSHAVRNTVRQFEQQASQQQVRIESHIGDNVMVNADGAKIHQVLLNLLLNALAVSKSGKTIVVSLLVYENNARISVRDHGTGIPEKDRKHIFDPFYTTKSTGSGLGLAIARSIIDEHDGSLDMRNINGNGAEFTITLPLLKG